MEFSVFVCEKNNNNNNCIYKKNCLFKILQFAVCISVLVRSSESINNAGSIVESEHVKVSTPGEVIHARVGHTTTSCTSARTLNIIQ